MNEYCRDAGKKYVLASASVTQSNVAKANVINQAWGTIGKGQRSEVNDNTQVSVTMQRQDRESPLLMRRNVLFMKYNILSQE